MKTLAKFLFSLSLLAGLTACDDDAPTTGEIVLDIEKYMYVQSISIYTDLGNYRISTYGYSDCTFQIQAGHTTRIDYDQHGNGVVTYD